MTRPGDFRGSARYKSFVRRGRRIVQDLNHAQFALGDLILDFEATEDPQNKQTMNEHQRALADDIGVAVETLRRYRDVAEAWPQERRHPDVGFHVHAALSQHKFRFRLIDHPPLDPLTNRRRWTADQVARVVGTMPHHPVTRDERVERIHALAQDEAVMTEVTTSFLARPEVAHRVIADRATRHALDRARLDQAKEAEAAMTRRNPSMRQLARASAVNDFIGATSAFVAAVERFIDTMPTARLGEGQRAAIRTSLERVHGAASWCETALRTGDVSLDEQLAQFLRGEQQ